MEEVLACLAKLKCLLKRGTPSFTPQLPQLSLNIPELPQQTDVIQQLICSRNSATTIDTELFEAQMAQILQQIQYVHKMREVSHYNQHL